MRDCAGVVTENVTVTGGLRRLVVKIAGGFETPVPGQFVNFRLGERTDPLLRRPFSVCSFEKGPPALLGILYAPVGRWTRLLAACGAGVEVGVLGPAGTGFVPGREDVSFLVAGGRGVAPLAYLSETLASHGRRIIPLVGARRKGDLYWNGATRAGEVRIATEDGSSGRKGFVTDLLETALAERRESSAVYSCGPLGMLKRVSELCASHGVPCQASVETVFACGLGVCRGCSVPAASEDAPYLMACSDGPVLRAEQVDWETFTS